MARDMKSKSEAESKSEAGKSSFFVGKALRKETKQRLGEHDKRTEESERRVREVGRKFGLESLEEVKVPDGHEPVERMCLLKIDGMKQDIRAEYQKKVDERQKELDTLHEGLEKLQKLEEHIPRVDKQIQVLENNIKYRETEISDLEKRTADRRGRVEELEDRVTQLSRPVADLHTDIKGLEAEIAQLKNKNNQTDEDRQSARSKGLALLDKKAQLKEAEEKLEKEQATLTPMQEALRKDQEEIGKKREALNDQRRKLGEQREKKAELTKEADKYNLQDIVAKRKEVEEEERMLKGLQEQYPVEEKIQKEAELVSLKPKYTDTRIQTKTQELRGKEAELKKLERTKTQEETRSLREEIEELRKEYSSQAINKNKRNIKKLDNEIQRMNHEIDSKQKNGTSGNYQTDIDAQKAARDAKKAELDVLEQNYKAAIVTKKDELKTLEQTHREENKKAKSEMDQAIKALDDEFAGKKMNSETLTKIQELESRALTSWFISGKIKKLEVKAPDNEDKLEKQWVSLGEKVQELKNLDTQAVTLSGVTGGYSDRENTALIAKIKEAVEDRAATGKISPEIFQEISKQRANIDGYLQRQEQQFTLAKVNPFTEPDDLSAMRDQLEAQRKNLLEQKKTLTELQNGLELRNQLLEEQADMHHIVGRFNTNHQVHQVAYEAKVAEQREKVNGWEGKKARAEAEYNGLQAEVEEAFKDSRVHRDHPQAVQRYEQLVSQRDLARTKLAEAEGELAMAKHQEETYQKLRELELERYKSDDKDDKYLKQIQDRDNETLKQANALQLENFKQMSAMRQELVKMHKELEMEEYKYQRRLELLSMNQKMQKLHYHKTMAAAAIGNLSSGVMTSMERAGNTQLNSYKALYEIR